jgi:hypothetical protein
MFAVVDDHPANDSTQAGSNANPDKARFAFLRVARSFGRVSGLYHQLSGFLEENISRFGELYVPLVADEQGNAEIVFQLADLAAQGRLRNVQLLRGLAEVQVFGDSEKVAYVP